MTAFPTPPKVSQSRMPRLFGFRTRLYLTWAALLCLFASFFLSFDLKFSIILDKLPNLVGVHLAPNGFLQGAALTLFLCLCSMAASSVLGFITALGRLSKSAVAFGIASFYASFFRGTPLLIQILLIYMGLPQLGLVPGAIVAGIIALSLNYGGNLSEIFRAGILGVPHGQREAALALGMRDSAIFWHVTLPQAMRTIIPPTTSQFISMLKDSSLISAIGLAELAYAARTVAGAYSRYWEPYLTISLMYWLMTLGLAYGIKKLEARYGRGDTR